MSELSRDEVSEMVRRLNQKYPDRGEPSVWSRIVDELRRTIFGGHLSVAAIEQALARLESRCARGSAMDEAVLSFRELLNARPIRETPREVDLPSLGDLRKETDPSLADLKTDPWLGRNEILSILGIMEAWAHQGEHTHMFDACVGLRSRLETEFRKLPAVLPTAPIPMLLSCPLCNARHIDKGEFATKVHHTHACQSCGMCWRPAVVPTVGVQYLPGFKDEA